jgi:hypothetical protein
MRTAAQRREQKEYRICLLEPEGWIGPLTAWAINRNSKRCHAVVNGDIASADVIWIYCQDPLPPAMQTLLEQRIRQLARPEAAIVNAPSAYNAYHQPDAFVRLSDAGVRVPRHMFTDADRGQAEVVYKASGRHGESKRRETYDGPRPGMNAFEFVDCRQADGMYRRYRAHYLLGVVRPSEAFVSPEWNVCADTAAEIEYTYDLTDEEVEQIRRIAEVLELQYFAVDFMRRSSDGKPVFTDVNVYPTIQSPRARVRSRGDFGGWHTFEARRRLGIPEPGGRDVWETFDHAVARFVQQKAESRAQALRIPSPDFIAQLELLRPADEAKETIRLVLPDLLPDPEPAGEPHWKAAPIRDPARPPLAAAGSA